MPWNKEIGWILGEWLDTEKEFVTDLKNAKVYLLLLVKQKKSVKVLQMLGTVCVFRTFLREQ